MDIEAHIGYYTLLLSRLVGETGLVYAFEPNADGYRMLKKNVEANNCTNVVIENKAVSSESGVLKFDGYHTRLGDKWRDCDYVEVECTSIDDYLKDIGKGVNFIKIDVEGFEPFVLKGCQRTIKNSKTLSMLVEYNKNALSQNNIDPLNLFRIIKDSGFDIFFIDDFGHPLDSEDLTRGKICDLFCVKYNDGRDSRSST